MGACLGLVDTLTKGCISDPHGPAKSVAFTEQGLKESERLLNNLFGARPR